ncbi:unnamed protein product [Diatraea saccharalis]|uniref:Uncharacterized protein n=1 Tax=Diatraea saccharalis TaxID=40085 RepID=A0A9N9RGP3_9NEOP|nr:unnamed protein product [Diatraea saccharalis]
MTDRTNIKADEAFNEIRLGRSISETQRKQTGGHQMNGRNRRSLDTDREPNVDSNATHCYFSEGSAAFVASDVKKQPTFIRVAVLYTYQMSVANLASTNQSLGPFEAATGGEMVSRRRILSRSRDDLTQAAQLEEEEDVWYQKDKLYKAHYWTSTSALFDASDFVTTRLIVSSFVWYVEAFRYGRLDEKNEGQRYNSTCLIQI